MRPAAEYAKEYVGEREEVLRGGFLGCQEEALRSALAEIRRARSRAEGTEDNEYVAGLEVAAGIIEDMIPTRGD